MSPAAATCRLISDEADKIGTLGPSFTHVEALGQSIGVDGRGFDGDLGGPFRVDNSAHHLSNFLERSTSELHVIAGNPSSVGVGVDAIDVTLEVEDLLSLQKFLNIMALAQVDVDAGSLGLGHVDQVEVLVEGIDSGQESRELRVQLFELVELFVRCVIHHLVAQLAHLVRLGHEFMDFAGISNSSKSSKCKGSSSHL